MRRRRRLLPDGCQLVLLAAGLVIILPVFLAGLMKGCVEALSGGEAGTRGVKRFEIPAIDLQSVKARLDAPQHGSALFNRGELSMSEAEMQYWIASWNSQDGAAHSQLVTAEDWDHAWELANMTALGEDRSYHWVNSYLVSIRPFATKNKWLPLYYLDQRKAYQWDHEQYGLEDVWQTSAQAFFRLRGDCEDHAIVLADWLISLGVDARVVAGFYEDEGHAWVVAFRDGRAFLLDATSKDSYRAWKHYPLASVTRGYRPLFMFNRRTYWVNDGDIDTTDYEGPRWRIAATYTPAPGAEG